MKTKTPVKDVNNLKVAIVHDWLVGGGAELVVQELHHLFPDAPIYTSYCTDEWRKKLDGKVVTGWLQAWPFSRLRKYIPLLRIWWFTHLKFDGYDLVISSSGNGEAKGVRVPQGTTHICYCHSPTHFYWRHYDQYAQKPGFKLGGFGLRLLVGPLRKWDRKAAQRPDFMIANSTHIQADIQKFYHRDSVVIHPPVDTQRLSKNPSSTRHGFVTVGRQVPYKRVDLIIEACNQLKLPLTVIGSGPEHARLTKLAGPTVKLLGYAPAEDVVAHIAQAQAFLFAAFEDFGITPVEALAAGTPVIAYKAGGAIDYIQPGKTGLFFDAQSVESLVTVLRSFDPKDFKPDNIQSFAQQFDQTVFGKKLLAYIKQVCR